MSDNYEESRRFHGVVYAIVTTNADALPYNVGKLNAESGEFESIQKVKTHTEAILLIDRIINDLKKEDNDVPKE